MNIYLHPDLWIEYINSRANVTQTDEQQLLYQLIVNKSNSFLYSHNWELIFNQCLNSCESEKYDYADIFSNILTELNYNDRLIEEVTPLPLDEEKDLMDVLKISEKAHVLLVKENLPHIDESFSIYDEIVKLNKHWISFSLASESEKDGTRLIPSDFSSNDEISDFFGNILNLRWLKRKPIFVRTDYLHFGPSFENIKTRKFTICTTNMNGRRVKTKHEKNADRITTRAALNDGVALKYSSNRRELHQRTIMCENLIIKQDHDSNEVNVSNNNWFLNFFFCEREYSESLDIIINQYN